MGLLDFLGTDDAKLGLGLLAAGGQSATPLDTWQRVQGAVQGLDLDKQRKLQLELLQSQADENKQQGLLRAQQLALAQRKQAWDEQFMGGGLLGAAPAAGAAQPSAMPAGAPPQQASAPGGGFTAQQISQQFGIPMEAVVADYRFNGGKKIAELIADKAKPNWMNVGGNLVNTNAPGFQGGIQDQVNISNDGRATVLRANGGNPVVGAPSGALDTYAAYQGIGARTSADYTPERVIDPSTGQTVVRPRSQVLQPQVQPGAGPVNGRPIASPLAPRAGDSDRVAIFAQERTRAAADLARAQAGGDPSAIARAQQDVWAIEKEIQSNRIPMPPAGGAKPMDGNVVELSPTQQTENKAAEARALARARADVDRETVGDKKAKSASEMIQAAQRARELLQQGPTQSGAGALADQAGAFVGVSNKGAEVASKLDIVAGDLINNVPRMEGPQSDGDRAEYAKQAGRVADRTIPASQRLAAVAEVERLQTKYAKQNSGSEPAKAAPKLLDALPTANTSNKGKRIRDTTTGKILVSDGMSWKEQ